MSSTVAPYTQFFIAINGIPRGWRWQNLKDHCRDAVSHGIWVDVARTTGETFGAVRLGPENDAYRLYDLLCTRGIEGAPVFVALWDITRVPARQLRSNYTSDVQSERPAISRMIDNRSLWNPSPEQCHAQAYPVPPSNQRLPSTPMRMVPTSGMVPQAPQAPIHQQYTQQPMQTSAYAQVPQQAHQAQAQHTTSNPQRLPINGANGIVRTEVRGVIVKNLAYRISPGDIKAKFSRAGTVLRCDLTRNHAGRSRGTAKVTYGSWQEAHNAKAKFNGYDWKERTLTVELLQEGVPVQHPTDRAAGQRDPVIADGTSGPHGAQNGL